jgi:DNA mismatch repair protein MutL
LSLQLANQIAAGEVVERPASVVKELLENAIDAHSSQILIDIEQGGHSLIRVSDNGDGINQEDLALAVTRHATSKLETLEELEQMMSLGFRGEALASVSAVSKLLIKSKPEKQAQAWMLDTGTDNDFTNYTAEIEPVAHPKGTTVDIRELFFNTPARRKFMRTAKTEFYHIDEVIKRIALSQFEISFKLSHNKRLVKNLPKAMTEKGIKQRINKLFSFDFLDNVYKVDFSSEQLSDFATLRLWGWVSIPKWYRKQSDLQYFYVNGRYIKDKVVNHALRQAYQTLLPNDCFFVYLLYLEIDPQQVDVNVHPSKHEVRFRQSRLIHDFILSALKQAMNDDQNTDSSLLVESKSLHNVEENQNSQSYQISKPYGNISHSNSYYHIADKTIAKVPINILDDKEFIIPTNKLKKSFFGYSLGCLLPNYLISQKLVKDNNQVEHYQLFVIHTLRAQQFLLQQLFKTGQIKPLLIPETMTLNSNTINNLLDSTTILQQCGVELSQLSNNTVLIRSLPTLYGIPACAIDNELLINNILSIILSKSTVNIDYSNLLIYSIKSMTLTLAEQAILLKMLSDWVFKSGEKKAKIGQYMVWEMLDDAKLAHLF